MQTKNWWGRKNARKSILNQLSGSDGLGNADDLVTFNEKSREIETFVKIMLLNFLIT